MRGRYRILLGMAAGVGKTYRMLQEGRQAQAEGRDVVIGYLEPHDRPQTAALAEGLETVPRRRVEHGALELEEMDVDAVIRRAPELALVDELAHTNAPGSRNEKRYQDIEEILDAGIDVISTVNVQHLESLNDAVFELTGVRVRETFPDRVLDEADEVVLVDLSPEALRDRLRAGKVYPERQAERALLNFFTQETSPLCASSRCVRWPRTSRRGSAPAVVDPLEKQAVASASSCSSSRSRARSACSVARGAPPAARERDRRALDAPARPGASAGRGDAAGGDSPSRVDPRRPLPRGGGRRPRRRPCAASPPSAARRTCSSERPTSAAASRSSGARSSRG